MVQKIIDIVGTSDKSFASAADNAVAEAAKTVRELKWGRVSDMEVKIKGKEIAEYRVTLKIYFDVER